MLISKELKIISQDIEDKLSYFKVFKKENDIIKFLSIYLLVLQKIILDYNLLTYKMESSA